jgi:hypothetical protein
MWESLKRLWDAWGHWNNLAALLDLFGWRETASGLAAAVLMWLLASFADWWLPYAFLAAAAVFFLVAIGVGLARGRRSSQPAESPVSVTLSDDVISITEFLRRAEQRGWRFAEPPASLHAIEICRRLREDARNDRLTFYGVEAKWQSPELLRNEVLEPIPTEHWRDFRIECTACFDIASPAGTISRVTSDNWRTETYTNRSQNRAPRFVNLHLDRRQAERWLNRVAPAESGTAPKATWPDFDRWDKVEEFRLFEAACLWCDETPKLPMSGAARSAFEELREAIYDGDLTASPSIDQALRAAWGKHVERAAPEDDPINVNTPIKRRCLVDYAKKTGKRPRFLFPGARA